MATENRGGSRVRGFDSLIMPAIDNPVPMPAGAVVPARAPQSQPAVPARAPQPQPAPPQSEPSQPAAALPS
jgi:hypothetical protein